MAVDDGVMDVDEQITLQQQRKTHDDGSTTSNLSSATMIASDQNQHQHDNKVNSVKIPPIFVLNLERASQRWEKAVKEMQRHGLEVNRLEAVDGKKLSEQELSSNSTRIAQFFIPRGVVGCYLSHRKFWQMVVDRGLPSAIGF